MRLHFDSRCGYCGVADQDAGGEFTVDHFVPVVHGGGEDEANLVYCCFRCKLYKSDFFPSKADRDAERLILHPLRDDVTCHFVINTATGMLDGLTETGRFHIALLHLNRPQLVTYRLRGRLFQLIEARHEMLQDENRELRTILAAQQKYIDRLLHLLGETPQQS